MSWSEARRGPTELLPPRKTRHVGRSLAKKPLETRKSRWIAIPGGLKRFRARGPLLTATPPTATPVPQAWRLPPGKQVAGLGEPHSGWVESDADVGFLKSREASRKAVVVFGVGARISGMPQNSWRATVSSHFCCHPTSREWLSEGHLAWFVIDARSDGPVALYAAQPDFEVVAEAGDGAQALELAGVRAVDLAVLDVAMPRMTGFHAAGELSASILRCGC